MLPIDNERLRQICNRFKLSLVVLFGSELSGKKGLDSDVDIAILADNAAKDVNADYELNLLHEFTKLLQTSKLDLVMLNFADPLLRFNVMQEGMALFEKEKGDFEHFKLLAIKQHLDAAKFYHADHSYLKNYIEGRKPMIKKEVIQRKLIKLKEYLDEMQLLVALSLGQYKKDIPKKRMAERVIQLIVECASDINSHIIVEEGLSPPKDYHESFTKLEKLQIYSEDFAWDLARFAGLRNRLVHTYEEIKDELVYKNILLVKNIFPRYISYIEKYLKTLES